MLKKEKAIWNYNVKTPKNQVRGIGQHIRFREQTKVSLSRNQTVGQHICRCALDCTKYQMPPTKEKKGYSDAIPQHTSSSSLSEKNKYRKYGLLPEANLAALWQKHLTRTQEKINVKIGLEELNVFHWGNKAVPTLVYSDANLRKTHQF